MVELLSGYSAFLSLGLLILGAALVIAWIILPFALIGTKGILQEILFELRKQNKQLLDKQKAASDPPPR
jgi:hypothetical protein